MNEGWLGGRSNIVLDSVKDRLSCFSAMCVCGYGGKWSRKMKFIVLLIAGFLLAAGGVGLFLFANEMQTMVMNGEVATMMLKAGQIPDPNKMQAILEQAAGYKVWGYVAGAAGFGIILFAFATKPAVQN